MTSRRAEFDLVVYGASGYTGSLVAEYLAERYATGGGLKWALAGRNLARLARLRDALGLPADHALIQADSADIDSIRAMVARTACVLSTVGPFQLYGTGLLEACATQGVDYLDICGEVPWMREMILSYGQKARDSGARVLFSCGFDSIPFEMGVFHHQREARARFGKAADRIKARVRAMNGTFSGGTAESFRATLHAIVEDKSLVAIVKDPFALTPGFTGPKQPSGMKIEFDPDVDAWVAPFLMSPINTRNVHRSNALLNHAYGVDFVYDEMRVAGPGPSGEAAAQVIAGEAAALAGRDGPVPGEGPTRQERDCGSFEVLFIGFMNGSEVLRTVVRGTRDPGYSTTSRTIVECAIALRHADVRPGIWTPAAALNEKLLALLGTPEVGMSFTIEPGTRA